MSPRYACLFAHDHPSTPDTDWEPEHGHFDGWAEWFEQVPLLFLYLIGDAQHLPQIAPWAIYGDPPTPCCLLAPMSQVRQRWAALQRWLQPRLPQSCAAARALWEQVDQTITASPRQWLLLDCVTLCTGSANAEMGTPAFAADLEKLRQRCADWNPQDATAPASLQPLLDAFERNNGWWNAAVSARRYDITEQYEPAFPAAALELCDPHERCTWDEAAGAYCVSVKKSAHQKATETVALVTEYGRWLVHPDEGSVMVTVQDGWISVQLHAEWPLPSPSGLKDINGQRVIPVSAGYRDLCVLSPALMQCHKSDEDGYAKVVQVRSLPGGRVLFDDLQGNSYREHRDSWIRITHADGRTSVIDATGAVVFAGPYQNIGAFSKKNGLAVVSDGKSEGVAHKSGKLIIPCQYKRIETGTSDGPPKLFPGSKLLALDAQDRPHVYNTKGALLAAPPIELDLSGIKDKDRLLALDGEGPDAEVLWFSMKDLSIERTGVSRTEYFKPLRDEMQRWIDRAKATPRTLTQEELLAAEDSQWMQSICRILCAGDDVSIASALRMRWLARIHEPTEEERNDPDLLTLRGDDNALTLYWKFLPDDDDAFEILHLDWKETDELEAYRKRHRSRAVVSLETDGDAYLLMTVRKEDGEAFVALLEQAAVRAVVLAA
jgi:hypothetical protein